MEAEATIQDPNAIIRFTSAYLDTFASNFKRRPSARDDRDLEGLSGSLNKARSNDMRRPFRRCVHQPTPDAIQHQNGMEALYDGRPTEAHFTVDIIPDRPESAHALLLYWQQRAYLRWNTDVPVNSETYSYQGDGGWNKSTFVMYVCPHRKSRARPLCLHVELRVKGERNLKRLGVTRAADLLKLSIRDVIRNRVGFAEIDFAALRLQLESEFVSVPPGRPVAGRVIRSMQQRDAQEVTTADVFQWAGATASGGHRFRFGRGVIRARDAPLSVRRKS